MESAKKRGEEKEKFYPDADEKTERCLHVAACCSDFGTHGHTMNRKLFMRS